MRKFVVILIIGMFGSAFASTTLKKDIKDAGLLGKNVRVVYDIRSKYASKESFQMDFKSLKDCVDEIVAAVKESHENAEFKGTIMLNRKAIKNKYGKEILEIAGYFRFFHVYKGRAHWVFVKVSHNCKELMEDTWLIITIDRNPQ